MTTKNKCITVLAAILLATPSCKKNSEVNPDGNHPPHTVDVPLKEARVILPAGSTYDLSGHELMAYGTILPVSKDGTTKTADIKGAMNIAYLFDTQNNPVMAGFVTDSSATLTVESTALVLLYYASGAAFMRDTVGQTFINRAREVSGVTEWIGEFTELWKTNPKTLASGTYQTALKSKVQELFNEPEVPLYGQGPVAKLASNKLTDILVDNNDIRSGLQVAQGEIGEIIVSNYYRRRAHAFFYKIKHKPAGQKDFITLINDIGNDTNPDRDLIVDGSTGATSLSGTAVKLINGKGMDFAVAHTKINMELPEDEDEAIYQVHIIGVGNTSNTKTKTEHDRKERLIIETFTFDFLMPLMGTTIGALGDEQKGKFVNAVEAFVKDAPGVYDALNKGDFKGAITSVFETRDSDKLNKLFEEMGEALVGQLPSKYAEKVRAIPVLKVTDGALQALDWGLITGYILASKQLESWQVTVRKSQVKLEPKEASVIPYAQIKLDAIVRNIQEAEKSKLRYEWSTSGQYGYLIDTQGNRGDEFESKDHQIFYNCNTPASNLGDENIEYIYVDVYLDGEFLGADSTEINVQKSGYVMRPGGLTVTGKKGTNGTQARLFLKPINWNIIPEIGPNDQREYKVVWSTEGKHGGLVSPEGGSILKTVTTYDRNGIVYECTDDNTRSGSESITARIYSRDKNASDAPFLLFDEVKGTVRINNDPKTRIVHLPVQLFTGNKIFEEEPLYDSRGNLHYSHRCYAVLGTEFKQQPEDDRYSITFHTAGGQGYTESGSWKAGDSINGWGYGTGDVGYDGTTYKVGTGLGTWSVGAWYPDQPKRTCDFTNATLSGEDSCILTITLK